MNVYTYWECTYCDSIVRGDSRVCPNCGSPIPNGQKYMMPDDPRVIKAQWDGKILVGGNIHTDEKGIVSEVVEKEKERKRPNWRCHSCGYSNFDEDDSCRGCGAPKTTQTYFDDDEDEKDSDTDEEEDSFEVESEADSSTLSKVREEVAQLPEMFRGLLKSFKNISWKHKAGALGVLALLAFIIWLFVPVQRTATVTGFRWEQTIDVEQFTLCSENDWTVPSGGRVVATAEEIHHYDTVLDHYETRTRTVSEQVQDGYETKTREVSEQVFDGYDTSYRDLGNGQAEVVQTPRYRTEYHTETYEVPKYKTVYHEEEYQVPIYVEVPVYQTKYYYNIDRWLYYETLTSAGYDQTPYWAETDIPEEVESPDYGDLRLGARKGTYFVKMQGAGETYDVAYSLSEWQSFCVGDELSYKSFRFSNKPLTETVVNHKED